MSVDLPAPFSPTRPTAPPKRHAESHVFQHFHPEKSLFDSCELQQGPGHALCPRESLPRRIKHRGKQDNRALGHRDRKLREIEKVQRIVQDGQEEHAKKCPRNLAFSAKQARPADHGRADHI